MKQRPLSWKERQRLCQTKVIQTSIPSTGSEKKEATPSQGLLTQVIQKNLAISGEGTDSVFDRDSKE